MKPNLIMFLLLFTCSISFSFGNVQQNSLVAVNDTVDITPGIPVTVNILANDSIPAGDSVGIVFTTPWIAYMAATINPNHTVTFTLNHWGYTGFKAKGYKLHDFTSGTFSPVGLVVFRIHDRSSEYLDINNVKALFNSSGLHFFKDSSEYEVPKGSGKTTMFSNSVWVGGKGAGDTLHFAGERYRQGAGNIPGTQHDFWAGPVSNAAGYNPQQDSIWNYVWKLNRSDIDYHRSHYWQQGYVAIKDILTWPAHGNVALGQAGDLAPFSDRIGNGIYEPYDGDYPEIRGDQALFFIYNDDRGFHAESNGEKLKIEIQGMAYAFDLPNDTAFKNTIFLHCKIINRSQNTYTGTWFGVFSDIDLGYANDDFVGCDPGRSMYYVYNGTPIDGTGQYNAYGANPPVQAVVILGGPTMDPDGYDNPSYHGSTLYGPSFKGSCDIVGENGTIVNMKYGPGEMYQAPFLVRSEAIGGVNFGDGIIDNERLGMERFVYHNNSNAGVPAYMTDPVYAPEYYQVMQGIWKDNTKMVYGGNGHLLAGGYGPECNFMFPGLSDSCNWGTSGQPPNGPKDWTEKTALNNPQDRRGLGSTGPFTFLPGQAQDLDIAFVWARCYNSPDSVCLFKKLDAVVDSVRNSYSMNHIPGGGIFYGVNEQGQGNSQTLQIFPNPASGMVYLKFPHNAGDPVSIKLISVDGTTRYTVSGRFNETIRLEIGNLQAGFYMVQAITGSKTFTGKVIVLK